MCKERKNNKMKRNKIVKTREKIARRPKSAPETLPKERPILFSTPMVKALLNDQKTVTRRIIKPQPIKDKGYLGGVILKTKHAKTSIQSFNSGIYKDTCPYGKPGDILWVRESWNSYNENFYKLPDKEVFLYKADRDDRHSKWRPSIHMPKAACRLKLEITAIRIEKLHKITPESAINEGIEFIIPRKEAEIMNTTKNRGLHLNSYENKPLYKHYPDDKAGNQRYSFPKPVKSYESLWDSINGHDEEKRWSANPYVWVIEFTVLKNK